MLMSNCQPETSVWLRNGWPPSSSANHWFWSVQIRLIWQSPWRPSANSDQYWTVMFTNNWIGQYMMHSLAHPGNFHGHPLWQVPLDVLQKSVCSGSSQMLELKTEILFHWWSVLQDNPRSTTLAEGAHKSDRDGQLTQYRITNTNDSTFVGQLSVV